MTIKLPVSVLRSAYGQALGIADADGQPCSFHDVVQELNRASRPEEREPFFEYSGAMNVRPCSRGTMLIGMPDQPGLEEVISEGDYDVEIKVYRLDMNREPSNAKR
jgi:hypothetical protein